MAANDYYFGDEMTNDLSKILKKKLKEFLDNDKIRKTDLSSSILMVRNEYGHKHMMMGTKKDVLENLLYLIKFFGDTELSVDLQTEIATFHKSIQNKINS